MVQDSRLPALTTPPPLLREHRLYQADWLLRFYHFTAEEILPEASPDFDPYLDPKCNWALLHPEYFPVEVNRASLRELLRVPGIGPKSAKRIVAARRCQSLGLEELRRIGVVLKRAKYFITCDGYLGASGTRAEIAGALVDPKAFGVGMHQLSLDEFVPKALPDAAPALHQLEQQGDDGRPCLPGTETGGDCMHYPAHVRDIVYRYDGSFQGFLCCVFESFSRMNFPPTWFLSKTSSCRCSRRGISSPIRHGRSGCLPGSAVWAGRSDTG